MGSAYLKLLKDIFSSYIEFLTIFAKLFLVLYN